LDYIDADNWREWMIIVTRKGDIDDYVPVSIDDDRFFLRSRYHDDPEFALKLQQPMDNPSHKLRAMSRNYKTSNASQVEMVAHLNQLQAPCVRSKRSGQLMKLKIMKD
jgi:hypothetical protein